MKRLMWAMVVASSLVGCGDDGDAGETEPVSVPSEGWSVTALKPTLSSDGATVVGGMVFARESGVEMRGGGVCLVADLHGATPCTTGADCASLPLPTGGFHYCAALPGGGAARCWTRPGEGDLYCTRSPSRAPGEYVTPAVPSLVDGQATLWASYACMAGAATPGGCGSGDPAQYVFTLSPSLATP